MSELLDLNFGAADLCQALTAQNELVMLYKIEPGASDQSLGIHVARLARFPEVVVADATEKAAQLAAYNEPLHRIATASLLPTSLLKRTRANDDDDGDAVAKRDDDKKHGNTRRRGETSAHEQRCRSRGR